MNTMIEEKRDYWVPLLKLMAELPNGKGRVAHIIKEHHGSILVESEEGKGASFIIKLPREYGSR